ncbi:MAG: phosphoribosylanthranilate isomerase [Phycisphaerae bacterium]|nr:phosphoribosylanthranilate isomerase [Phycisphaerae bacterium]
MRIKICGITRVTDARSAADAGADAIGLVFAPSPRRVDVRTARKIVRALPPFVTPVGVFVNAPPRHIRRIAGDVGLSVVQLHGDEPPGFVAALAPLRVIKTVRLRTSEDLRDWKAWHRAARVPPAGVLIDSFVDQVRGGTGRTADWRLAGQFRGGRRDRDALPLILAGGLTAANVTAAIRLVRPDAVDVSSGVEQSPGIKNPRKMSRFVSAARDAFRRYSAAARNR